MQKSNFSTISNDFLKYSQQRHKKQGFETLERNFKLHILPYFKDRNVQDITQSNIVDWETKILKYNYSNSFNKNLFCVLHQFFKFCVINNYINENIVEAVDKFPKKIEQKKYNIYTIWEFRKFRHHLKNFVIKQYFNFMFFYGTRPSEAMALKFSDFDNLYCNIIHSIQRRGKRELDTPKNQSSIRTIKISLLTWFRLYKLKKYYIKKYGLFDIDYYVFGGKKPLSTTTIDRYKEKACKSARMRAITQHQFRHSYATRKIHNKTPIDIVSKNLGHSRVSTTVDKYLHAEKRKHKHCFLPLNF